MTPSLVPRPSRFAADACPFTRSSSTARSTSPSASTSADFASIIAAPVRSRSAFTSAAVTVISTPHLSPQQPAPHSQREAPEAAPPKASCPQRPAAPPRRSEPVSPRLPEAELAAAGVLVPAAGVPVAAAVFSAAAPEPAALSAAPQQWPAPLSRRRQPLFWLPRLRPGLSLLPRVFSALLPRVCAAPSLRRCASPPAPARSWSRPRPRRR